MAGETMSATRIRAIDWLRGLAVFDMIMWHAGCVITPGHVGDSMYWWLQFLSGLVAPSFMFAAGFAIALVMVRSSGDPAARRRRAIKSLQRIGEVLAVAFVLKLILRGSQPGWLLRIDILSCIALSLLLAWPVQYLLAPKPKVAAAVCAALSLLSFAFATVIPESAWSRFVEPGSSDFALVPWAGYVFLGSTVGAMASMGTRHAAAGLAGVVALGAVFRLGPWPWVIANAGERCMLFGAVALALLGLEQLAVKRRWTLTWPPFSFLEVVGTSALTAYVTHALALWLPVRYLNVRWYWPSVGWVGYWAITVGLWFLAIFVCWGWPKLTAKLPRNRPKATSSSGPPRPA